MQVITVLSDCDQSDQACWQLIVRIEFSWEGSTQNVSYEENFTSLTEAEKTENRINDMEHIVVDIQSAKVYIRIIISQRFRIVSTWIFML